MLGTMLAEERRRRLVAVMREAGIGHMVLYGNAWQGDYLRYGADFGILEGHGIALITADGEVELFLDSATDAERAELEAPQVKVQLAPDIARAVGARLDRVANAHIAAAPRRFLPRWLADATRSFKLDDATALVDQLLMRRRAQARSRRCAAPRRLPTRPMSSFYARCGRAGGNMILEGHGIALIAADGEVELFLDSATEAERAEPEAPQVQGASCPRHRARGRRAARSRRQCAALPPHRGGSCRAGLPTRREISSSTMRPRWSTGS